MILINTITQVQQTEFLPNYIIPQIYLVNIRLRKHSLPEMIDFYKYLKYPACQESGFYCKQHMIEVKKILYIGESENLQNKFAAYIDTNFENNACKQKTYAYQRTFTKNPKEQKKLLLDNYKDKHGNFPCCNADAC